MTESAAIYVSNADSRDIHVLRLDRRAGTVELRQVVETGGMVMPLAVSPDRRFLYAALRSEPYSVASYAIDANTGELERIGTAPLPDSMAYVTTDRKGDWLFAASYGGHKASVSPIGEDGVAQEPVGIVPTGKNAHAAVVDPGNRFVFVTNLGSDQVQQFRFETGRLTPNDPPALAARAGAGPRHLVFHPDRQHAYLLNELDATVDLLAFDSQRGTLQLLKSWPTLPEGSTVKPWGADLHLTPDGKFLYTSERNSHTIAMWRVGADGGLTLLGHQPTEQQPRGFNIDSSGQWLVAAGQLSNHVTVYRIDRETGKLAATARVAVGQNPNWVETCSIS